MEYLAEQNDNERVIIEGARIEQRTLTGERAAYMAHDSSFVNATFKDGESPLKHSRNITLENASFKWKYPLWHSSDVMMKDCTIFDTGRAGIWYTDKITLDGVVIEAPKEFRRCHDITLSDVQFANAAETLWHCDGVTMRGVYAKGEYFAMNSSNMKIDRLTLVGNYPFDGVRNVDVSDSKLISKDAFWNSDNITIRDSYISGEYFGWNSRNITLINCTVESLQGFCYIQNLVMKNCVLVNTNLAFEYSTVDVEVTSRIDSVKNPLGGTIRAKEIGEIILDETKVDITKTRIITGADCGTSPAPHGSNGGRCA